LFHVLGGGHWEIIKKIILDALILYMPIVAKNIFSWSALCPLYFHLVMFWTPITSHVLSNKGGACNMPKTCITWVCHTMALLFTFQKYLKAKEELWKLKYFHYAKILISQKSSNRRNQNPSRYYYNSTNLKFQHKPKKKNHLSKILV
jgi:hypothetical protein